MEKVSQITLQVLKQNGYCNLQNYDKILSGSFDLTPPPYGKKYFSKEYFRMARNSGWFAGLLISDADIEGYSAGRLWDYTYGVEDQKFKEGMRAHALDEARHSRLFTRMLFRLFPELETEKRSAEMLKMAPDLKPLQKIQTASKDFFTFEEVLNSAILINLYEIKALIMLKLLGPTLTAYCDSSEKTWAKQVTSALIKDEARHIGYTADFIEKACNRGYKNYVSDAVEEFQKALNEVTTGELEETLTSFNSRKDHFEELV